MSNVQKNCSLCTRHSVQSANRLKSPRAEFEVFKDDDEPNEDEHMEQGIIEDSGMDDDEAEDSVMEMCEEEYDEI
jgi:hypothetical protein